MANKDNTESVKVSRRRMAIVRRLAKKNHRRVGGQIDFMLDLAMEQLGVLK